MLASPFQLLELNIISAQDLAPVSKSIKAYAVAWLNPERKLTTQIDPNGQNNPTWNEKFVFRVDDDFLTSDESLIIIEIYASAWLRDILIGTVTVLASNLLNILLSLSEVSGGYSLLSTYRLISKYQGLPSHSSSTRQQCAGLPQHLNSMYGRSPCGVSWDMDAKVASASAI